MGGGGNDNSAMMMMMSQQNAASEQRAREEAAAQRQYQSERDAQNRQDAQAAALREDSRYSQQRQDEIAQRQAADALSAKTRQEDFDRQTQSAATLRQQQIDDRNYQQSLVDQARQRDETAAQKKKDDDAATLTSWKANRDAVYGGYKSDANARLQSLGVSDPNVSAALMSALGTASAAIPDNATNVNSYFDGVIDKAIGQQTDAARTRYGNQLNSLLPTDFQNTKVADDVDDSILESILGKQYDSAAADAKRLLDRGVITQEGYDANLKQLGDQRNTGRSRLTQLGDNELNAERTRLGNIANQGRSAASTYQLGQTFDPNKYATDVNSAYDKWFGNLESTLSGIAPTDLFDTSSFLNTAGRTTGATNSPFVGSTNALTGDNALTDSDYKKKKDSSTATPSMGVF